LNCFSAVFVTVENYMGKHIKTKVSWRKVRAALSTGNHLVLGDVDGRSAPMVRLKDLQHSYQADLGGEEHLSEGQRTMVRRLAMTGLQLDLMEADFANNEGRASPALFDSYKRGCDSERRYIESLGISKGRIARDVTEGETLEDYLASKHEHDMVDADG
jgi:hypothetical protein